MKNKRSKKLGKVTKKTRKINKKLEQDELVRLNKFIADAGYTSRRKADKLIEEGRVSVNGSIVKELGTQVKRSAFVTIDGDPIGYKERLVYYILNKPKDTITTTDDEYNRKTVMGIIKTPVRVYPVGRLDRNSTGVLLMTNDGELANRLMHPKYEVSRIYKVKLDKDLKHEDARAIAQGGVKLDKEETAPCEILINPKDNSRIIMNLIEGKNREIRRVFEKFGYFVKKLDRKEYGGISNAGMSRGQYRQLTKKEVEHLKKLTGIL